MVAIQFSKVEKLNFEPASYSLVFLLAKKSLGTKADVYAQKIFKIDKHLVHHFEY